MDIDVLVDDEEICRISLFSDKVPQIEAEIRKRMPIRGLAQHGKLVGQMVFFTVPIVAPWENRFQTEDIPKARGDKGGRGAVCFYNPRQQICLVYGNDLAAEPLPISYVGEITEGLDRLEVIGMRTWLKQGAMIELRAA
jgi:hypothetical protein